MSRQSTTLPLRVVREELGFSREHVVRRAELDPPISTKTLERWEAGAPVKGFRYAQLAAIYGVSVDVLQNGQETA